MVPIINARTATFVPRAATRIRASRMIGIAKSASTMRIITSSTQPPICAAKKPHKTPTVIAITDAKKAIIKEMRPPYITRLSTSLPRSSAPNKCCRLGLAKMLTVSSSFGSEGAIKSAKIAEINRIEIKMKEILPSGFLRTLLKRLFLPIFRILICF